MFFISLIKTIIHKGIPLLKYYFGISDVLLNVNKTSFSKNCLLSYIQRPFSCVNGLNPVHQNQQQVVKIAEIIGSFGYNVDVADFTSKKAILVKKYDAVFDILARENPVYKNNLSINAKRIIYFTGSESKFANNAELTRISNLYNRKRIKLKPRRQAPKIIDEVQSYDEVILIGNAYNLKTYTNRFNFKSIDLVSNTGYGFDPDYLDCESKSANNFLFFGSSGCVHKGLDLLLDIFSEKGFPCNLYVCGNYENEKDFKRAYYKELYSTKNVIPVGFVNILSEEFKKICQTCTYTILPSCSEGQAGSITTCMSAGLIPICSRECGFEDNEVINLEDCEIDTIRNAILYYSQKDKEWIEENQKKVVELTKTKYSMENFEKEMRAALSKVL